MTQEPVARLRGLSKSYATEAGVTPVLHGIDLDVPAGQFMAVMGPSGSGKSTLMNLLGCLDTPDSGSLEIGGQATAALGPDALAALRNATIGFVFQGFNLLPRASVEANVALPLVYRGVPAVKRLAEARALLERVGLSDHASKRPAQLSGGQQQRVAVARALIGTPKLLLADEPTGNLDTATSREVLDLFTELNRRDGLTIILVTHEAEVAAYAHRLVHMRDGRIDYDGAPADFFTREAA